MLPPRSRALSRTASLLAVIYGAWTLGRYTVWFSGSTSAWIALVASIVLLFVGSGALLRVIWTVAYEK
jgi:hypothetical protein